jgi:hypothetical protein
MNLFFRRPAVDAMAVAIYAQGHCRSRRVRQHDLDHQRSMQMSAVQKIEPRQEIASAQPVTPMEMLASAIDKGMSIETIDRLVALAERLR